MRRETAGVEPTALAGAGAGVGLAAVGAGAGAGWSLGLVTLPDRLKFWSSLGPTVVDEGEEVGGDCCVSWASATAGASQTAPASNTAIPRKIALISSRSLSDSPHHSPAASLRQCPPRAQYSSTWLMNGAVTPI